MKQNQTFFRMVCNLAIPVALQSMLQSSFSMVDQLMIGQLGSVSVAGVGLAAKFSSVFSVILSAVGAVAGIMISQYLGQKNHTEVSRSFFVNLSVSAGIACVFTGAAILFPEEILRLYTSDQAVVQSGASYLAYVGGSFLPMTGASMMAVMLRCMERAILPLYAGIAAAVLNTGLNYILIFGKLGMPAMGANGAAVATVISQIVYLVIICIMMFRYQEVFYEREPGERKASFEWRQYLLLIVPVFVCELMWSLGENVYAGIYGHLGTDAAAAVTLTNPIQGLLIGALCGLAQAAGVIIGKKLGREEYEEAYQAAKKLMLYGLAGALVLSGIIAAFSRFYVEIYQVESEVKQLTVNVLTAYAVIAPVKVENMILGSGILRSGGKTQYVMIIDLIGTWMFGVPLGIVAAFVLDLPVYQVYFILSLEECIRFALSVAVFRRKKWMQMLGKQ